jgi:Type I phosphodiesterase / nucleotide pyrophosphatase.
VRNRYLYITLLALLGVTPESLAQSTIQYAPRLVVTVTIDQLRADYLEAFAPLYGQNGFKRLMQQGRVFPHASYPFSPIDRASALASLATGVTPYYHSIVGERWLNRETLRPVWAIGEGQTADNLSTSTLGDELKVSTEGKAKVYAVAPTADAAVMSVGHAADAALWIDDTDGLWKTSQYYSKEQPSWLLNFNALHSPNADDKKLVWEPVIELTGTFNYFQHAASEQKPFKHKFTGNRRYTQLIASGIVNEFVTDMAQQVVTQATMGYDRVTDLLSLTYYAGTFDHMAMSECQLELQDTYMRLDRELSRLITTLERRLGAEHVMFVVTSTGYSDTESSAYDQYRIPTGTFYMNRTSNLLNMYFGAIWGQGRWVETCFGSQLFLNHKLLESKRVSLTDAGQRAQEFLSQLSGVRNVYTGLQLLTSTSEQTQKIRAGYNPERCGDILIEVSPGWKLLNEDTQQTQLQRASFIQFPIIFYGAGIEADTITDHVTVDRIAPTIAKSIRIRAPNACMVEPLF